MKQASEDGAHVQLQCDASQITTLETREAADRMAAILAGLPENQQEVIRLKFQGGLSYREISEVTKLSVSNVGYLIHTAIKSVRLRMAAET